MTLDLEEGAARQYRGGMRQGWSKSENGNWDLGPRAWLQGTAASGCGRDLSFQTDTNILEVLCSWAWDAVGCLLNLISPCGPGNCLCYLSLHLKLFFRIRSNYHSFHSPWSWCQHQRYFAGVHGLPWSSPKECGWVWTPPQRLKSSFNSTLGQGHCLHLLSEVVQGSESQTDQRLEGL